MARKKSGISERGWCGRGRSEIPHVSSKLQLFALVLGEWEKRAKKNEEKRKKKLINKYIYIYTYIYLFIYL